MAPRPDQLERIKKLGLVASQAPMEIHLISPSVFAAFGERAAEWVVPKKRVTDAGIISTFEFDRALGSTDLTAFHVLSWAITRRAWDGKVCAADQKVSREVASKAATMWGSYYVQRETVLGSLEQGKWADFIIIDRDYLTIPGEDVQNIRVLMTSVGGKIVHLVPSLAKEMGMQPGGAQVTLGFTPQNGEHCEGYWRRKGDPRREFPALGCSLLQMVSFAKTSSESKWLIFQSDHGTIAKPCWQRFVPVFDCASCCAAVIERSLSKILRYANSCRSTNG